MLFTITVCHLAFGDDGEPVAVISATGKDELEALEHAYRLTNSIWRPWWQNDAVTLTAGGTRRLGNGRRGLRSTSIGDRFTCVRESDGERSEWAVASFGFVPESTAKDDAMIQTHRRVRQSA